MTHEKALSRRSTFGTVLVCSALALGGCADADREAAPSIATAAEAPAQDDQLARDKSEEADGDSDGKSEARAQRKLIQTAELHVEVGSYASARSEIEKNLAAMGGFIADASVQHHDGSVSYADLTIRIPSDKLEDFLAGTAGHGDVLHETVRSQDITEGYYDMKARLKNAKRLETRLLVLLDSQADTVTSLLEVERELARVRGQIESFEGKLRLWDNQVSLSTVRLRLVTRQVYAMSEPPTLMSRLEETLGGSFGALKSFGLGLLVMLVALIPWLIPLGVVGWGFRALVRRVLRGRAARRGAATMPATSVGEAAV